jgi:hypothetical protein
MRTVDKKSSRSINRYIPCVSWLAAFSFKHYLYEGVIREKDNRLPGWTGDLSLPRQQYEKEANPHVARASVLVADPTAGVAQGFSAHP